MPDLFSVIPSEPLEVLGQKLEKRFANGRFPYSGQWELTCRCNLRCAMCYTDCFNTPEKIQNELSTSEILRILKELAAAGVMDLVLTGGEPLSRPDFMTIYEAAHAQGFLLTVFTNGTLITEDIADRWVARPPKMVEISLHGTSAEVFERVTRMPGSLNSCLRGINLLVKRKIPLTLKTVGMTLNREEILSVKRFAAGLGPNVFFHFGEEMRDDLLLSGAPFEYQLSGEELDVLERQDAGMWSERQKAAREAEAQTRTCGGGRQTFHIDAYGRLQLCSNNRRASYDLRQGSFHHGFFEALPSFPCPNRPSRINDDPSPGLSLQGRGISKI